MLAVMADMTFAFSLVVVGWLSTTQNFDRRSRLLRRQNRWERGLDATQGRLVFACQRGALSHLDPAHHDQPGDDERRVLFLQIAHEAREAGNAADAEAAPRSTPVGRVDETRAARKLVVTFDQRRED